MISKQHIQGAKSAVKSTLQWLYRNPTATREEIINLHLAVLANFDHEVEEAIKEMNSGNPNE